MKTLTKTFARRVISALLVTIMVFSLGITSIVSTSAAEVELAPTAYNHSGGYLYFYNTNGWSNVSILVGPTNTSSMYTFTKLSGNLYYLDMPEFKDWHNWVILDAAGWGYSSTQGVYDRSSEITGKIAYQESYSFNDGSTYFITPTNNSNSWYKSGGYSDLNYTQKAICQVSTDGGSTYIDSTDGGSVKVSTYKLTGNGTGSTASETGSRSSAVGTSVTMTATVNDGYTFAGWYSGTTKVDSDTTYTYTNSGSAKTVYARFVLSSTLASVTLTSDKDECTVNEEVTFTATSSFTGPSNVSVKYDLIDTATSQTVDTKTTTTGSATLTATPTESGDKTYRVVATYNGTTKTDEYTIKVNPALYANLSVTTATSGYIGDKFVFSVDHNVDDYTSAKLYDEEDIEVTGAVWNAESNTFTLTATAADTFKYKVKFVVDGESVESEYVTITVVDPSAETNTVVIKFKAPEAWGYIPKISINDGAKQAMTKADAMFAQNDSYTAKYFWYSYTLQNVPSDAETKIEISASRDSFYKECTYTLVVMNEENFKVDGANKCFYFALENLNDDDPRDLVNISTDPNRDKCISAVNMIIDESDIASLPTLGYTFSSAAFGDSNCDGKVNVRDATYIQKCLANIEEADELSTIVSDFNQDGNVTIKDATAVQKAVAGL